MDLFYEKTLTLLRRRLVSGGRVVYRLSAREDAAKEGRVAPPDEEAVRRDQEPDPERAAPQAGRKAPLPPEGIRYKENKELQNGLFDGGPKPDDDSLKGMTLEQLEEEVAACKKCGLHADRTNTVFGAGDSSAGIVFIGEAPGREEDLRGIPFVGRAGKLLDRILAAIDLSRDDVYIANILKCRPPGNRDPNEDESKACEGYLKRQLELIDPAVICALGRVAAQNLLKTKSPLGKMRGKIHYYNDIKTIVTYHPAALLRNPHFKRPAWEDMKVLRRIYDESLR